MTFERFDRKLVHRGDLLLLARDPSRRLLFKFMSGHLVVGTWLEPPKGRPSDVILLQRDVQRAVIARGIRKAAP